MGFEKKKLVLRKGVIKCSNNEILIRQGIRDKKSKIIRDDAKTNIIGRVYATFRVPTLVEDFLSQLKPEEKKDALDFLQLLYSMGWLVDENFNTLEEVNSFLKEIKLGIIYRGSNLKKILDSLGEFNFKEVSLWIEGKTKKDELTINNVRFFNEELTENSLKKFIDPLDFLVVILDEFSPNLLHSVNEQCLKRPLKWIGCYFNGSEVVITPLFVPGETVCYNETEIQLESVLSHRTEYFVYKESIKNGNLEGKDSYILSYNFLIGINLLLNIMINFLLTNKLLLKDRGVVINFDDLVIDYYDVLRLPKCPACNSESCDYTHVFL
ncbi:hypothetical protein [Caldisericum exile]|uniref:THIF-type NAD/FAD binding fold domain-containing protein n=1 Tax=Caldisericum exile (strain DSM 21853 / NBRC 104410 / AZM16c01) TaxID=511051 RepID=A0A7U6GD55_CALEA|nr:hypothetical protein [Caldisericum exile]BAL80237.1 hypothetical protein CSE_01110 [Caldisericum exile AZM16c01]